MFDSILNLMYNMLCILCKVLLKSVVPTVATLTITVLTISALVSLVMGQYIKSLLTINIC